MVSKKLLSAAIASAFLSVPAFAVINLDADPLVPVSYAKQSLKDNLTQNSTVGSIKHYEIDGNAANLDFSGKIGVGIAADDQVFVRVTLTNAVFETAAVAGDFDVATTVATSVSQGGQAGDAYAIFAITAPAGGFAQNATATMNLADLAVLGTADVGYAYAVYETLSSAINQTSPLYSKSVAGTVKLVDGLTATKTTANATANVSDDFKLFTGGISTTLDNLGSFETNPSGALAAVGGAAAVAADIYSAASVKIVGDFSVGTWQIGDDATCANLTSTNVSINTGKTELTVPMADLQAKPQLCVTLPGDKVINKGSYAATATFTAAANSAFAQAAVTNDMGAILHNGTTIQVPYLTTFTDYNQRLILVNRGGVDAAYTVTFQAEDGITTTAGTAATGTLKAGKQTVIKATDLVSITGSTRTAATVNIVAVSTNIDAATTQVNLSDKSTDTVKLQ